MPERFKHGIPALKHDGLFKVVNRYTPSQLTSYRGMCMHSLLYSTSHSFLPKCQWEVACILPYGVTVGTSRSRRIKDPRLSFEVDPYHIRHPTLSQTRCSA